MRKIDFLLRKGLWQAAKSDLAHLQCRRGTPDKKQKHSLQPICLSQKITKHLHAVDENGACIKHMFRVIFHSLPSVAPTTLQTGSSFMGPRTCQRICGRIPTDDAN